MPLTETEKLYGHLFDQAMVLRDGGEYRAAIELLLELVSKLTKDDRRLRSFALGQLSYIYMFKMGDPLTAVEYASRAIELSPQSELLSLGLFHALHDVGRMTDALQEMVRFLLIRPSRDYMEIVDGGFSGRFSDEQRALIAESRALVARHRVSN